MRKKDVVLMATVTSFESLAHPVRSELRQFAELFKPLFCASSEEARREAVAALSRCATVPPAVAFFIASQPIAIAAPFLTFSPCLSDETLIAVARMQGSEHARAIARRENLAPGVIDALVGLRHDRNLRRAPDATEAAPSAMADMLAPAADETEESDRLAREEELRRRIKLLAGQPVARAKGDRLGLRQISDMQGVLLVRFAREREANLFMGVLADALSASTWLARRIMLDISGRQLATALKGMFMADADAIYILGRLYDHLTRLQAGRSQAENLWNGLDADECGMRLEAWRRADHYTYAEPADAQGRMTADLQDNGQEQALENEADARPLRTSASIRRTAHGR